MVRSLYREYDGTGDGPQGGQDAQWLDALQRGDERALAALYDRYARLIYSVSLRVLRDATAAEDVLQEIFMQLWRRPESFLNQSGSLAGSLALMARHRSVDMLRRRKSTTAVEAAVLASRADHASETEMNTLAERARHSTQTMPRDQRKTLEMVFFDGLTHGEIAEMTGEPVAAVKTRLRTGLQSLRKVIQG